MTTLAQVEAVIAEHTEALREHPFLKRLEGAGDIGQLKRCVSRLGFFILAFQDMLRVAAERCTDPEVLPIVRGLQRDDRGHDLWYLEDAARLDSPLGVDSMFSPEAKCARDTSYAILAEIATAKDDRARLAILLSLEASAREFFERVPHFAARVGAPPLKFFGQVHLDAEAAHEAFHGDEHERLARIPVEDAAIPLVLHAVESTFGAMARLADDLDEAMANGATAGQAAK